MRMERAVPWLPNPTPHVVPIAPEPLRQFPIRTAVEQMKRLHRPAFGNRDAHLAGPTPPPRWRLTEVPHLSQCAVKFGPEGCRLFRRHR
jgi:hypothetical protein